MRGIMWAGVLACLVMGVGGAKSAETSSAVKTQGLSPKETIKVFQKAMADQDAVTLWNLLPKTYQEKFQKTATLAAKTTDPQVWAQGVAVSKKAGTVIKKQEDLIKVQWDNLLKKKNVIEYLEAMKHKPSAKEIKRHKEFISATAQFFAALAANPVLSSHEKALGANVVEVAQKRNDPIMQFVLAVRKHEDNSFPETWAQFVNDIKVTKEGKNQATIVWRDPTRPAEGFRYEYKNDGTEERIKLTPKDQLVEMNLVKVDGKWIPQSMKQFLDLQWGTLDSRIPRVLGNKAALLATLGQLDKAYEKLGQAKNAGQMHDQLKEGYLKGMFGIPFYYEDTEVKKKDFKEEFKN